MPPTVATAPTTASGWRRPLRPPPHSTDGGGHDLGGPAADNRCCPRRCCRHCHYGHRHRRGRRDRDRRRCRVGTSSRLRCCRRRRRPFRLPRRAPPGPCPGCRSSVATADRRLNTSTQGGGGTRVSRPPLASASTLAAAAAGPPATAPGLAAVALTGPPHPPPIGHNRNPGTHCHPTRTAAHALPPAHPPAHPTYPPLPYRCTASPRPPPTATATWPSRHTRHTCVWQWWQRWWWRRWRWQRQFLRLRQRRCVEGVGVSTRRGRPSRSLPSERDGAEEVAPAATPKTRMLEPRVVATARAGACARARRGAAPPWWVEGGHGRRPTGRQRRWQRRRPTTAPPPTCPSSRHAHP